MNRIDENGWVYCPVCNGKTKLKVKKDTFAVNLPLFCPKCKQISLIKIENQKMIAEPEPRAGAD
jgi:uncharacterized Zn finger protein (UPF0148 family)